MGLKKLYVYREDVEATLIDQYTTKEWENIVIVEVCVERQEELDELSALFEDIANDNPEKEFILVPRSFDIAFYGVEVEDEQEPGE